MVTQPEKTSPDEEIWEKACNDILYMQPPRQWTFEDCGVKFGCDLYYVDKTTLYELALLDVHSQFYETTSPKHLRRYHRGLQYNVEHIFQSAVPISTYHTPSFLNGWLVRVIFMKPHDGSGRRMMEYILNDVRKDQRLKLEMGNFQEDDWKEVISHPHHKERLSQMIKTICSERRISKNSETGYAWNLPIFEIIKQEKNEDPSPWYNDPPMSMLLYKCEVIERKWEGILELSKSLNWMIDRVPFQKSGVERLLHGRWLNDNVIDAYLELCGCLRPDIKFIQSHWFPSLERWGSEALSKSAHWILKGETNAEAAIKKFSAVITVINYPSDHWITLQFNPKEETLEVFNSLAPQNVVGQNEEIRKMMLQPLGLKNWHIQARENVPQQEGISDCGVYACQFAKHLALEIPFLQSLSEKQCAWIRKTMVVELADGRLRIPWR